jgi:hypothetical protein
VLDKVQEWTVVLVIVGLISAMGAFVGHRVPIAAALPGILILAAISLAGFVLAKAIPVKFPAMGYISIIAFLLTIPQSPVARPVVTYTGRIPFMALATPVLAYAGIAIGKSWADFTRLGWKTIVVSLLVLFGTYIGSAIIAEIVLRIQGVI